MADGTETYRVRNAQGGYDLTAEGWAVMAELMERAADCTRRCAEALKDEGRESVNFREARREWTQICLEQLSLCSAGVVRTPN